MGLASERDAEGQRTAEYNTFRGELQSIITIRYSIFVSLTMIYGLLFAFVGTSFASSLVPILPLLLLTVTFPVLLVDHYLVAHRRRLDSFLEVLEESAFPDFAFYRLYPISRRIEAEKAAERWLGPIRTRTVQPVYVTPLLYAYLSLIILGAVISAFLGTLQSVYLGSVELATYVLACAGAVAWTLQTHELKDVKKAWRFLIDERTAELFPPALVLFGIDTLIEGHSHREDFDDWEAGFEREVFDAFALLRPRTVKVAFVVNQPGPDALATARMDFVRRRLLKAAKKSGLGDQSFGPGSVYVCPHTESEKCDCRRPKTALLRRAVDESGRDPSDLRVYVVGDRWDDIRAGVELNKEVRLASLKTVLVGSPAGDGRKGSEAGLDPTHRAKSLAGAAFWIRDQEYVIPR